jgi:hypothetical protein
VARLGEAERRCARQTCPDSEALGKSALLRIGELNFSFVSKGIVQIEKGEKDTQLRLFEHLISSLLRQHQT